MTERPDFPRHAELGHRLPRVMRLGLATRGNARPSAEDVAYAVEHGATLGSAEETDAGRPRRLPDLPTRASGTASHWLARREAWCSWPPPIAKNWRRTWRSLTTGEDPNLTRCKGLWRTAGEFAPTPGGSGSRPVGLPRPPARTPAV
jgi:hypothetical protein